MASADFLIDVGNPDGLLRTLTMMGATLLTDQDGEFLQIEGHYVMRALGNADFMEWSCKEQGYCTIVRRLDELLR
jgi:hypothetical protein